MQETNISGLLGMSRDNDNDSDYDFNNRNDYKSRQNRQRKHYIESGYKTKMGIDLDIDTGEILNFVPKALKNMAYNNRRSYRSSGVKMPDISKLLPFAMYGAIGLAGYKVYQHFFGETATDIVDNSVDKGNKALAALHVDQSQVKADTLKNTAQSLANKGLTPAQNHQNIADYFLRSMNSWWVDGDAIVSTILKQNVQTFRLASVAFKTQTLKEYCDYHISAFASEIRNKPAPLKDCLKLVLSTEQQRKISAYLNVI